MSIGKNAIKRVENNGYSHVQSDAPDMEDSVIAEPAAAVPAEPAKPAARRKKEQGKDGFSRVAIGGELPVWLL